jgi:hypothetical protein
MSVRARVEYPSIAEPVDIFFYAHSRVEVVLWFRAIVCDRLRDRLRADWFVLGRRRLDQVVLSRTVVASIVLESIVL